MYDFTLAFPQGVTFPLTTSVFSLTRHILRCISMAHAELFSGCESGPHCSHDAATRPLDPRRTIAVQNWCNPTNKFHHVSAHTLSWRPCTCRRFFSTAAASGQGAARRANAWTGSLFVLCFGCSLPKKALPNKALCADLLTCFSFAVHFAFHSSPECSSRTLETTKSLPVDSMIDIVYSIFDMTNSYVYMHGPWDSLVYMTSLHPHVLLTNSPPLHPLLPQTKANQHSRESFASLAWVIRTRRYKCEG